MQRVRKKITNFLKSQDQLSISHVSVTYTNADGDGFGTSMGGICSLITSLFFVLFIIIQVYTWMFKPNYNQAINIDYNPLKGNPKYDIPLTLFLPAFSIQSGYFTEENERFNDFDTWRAEWIQKKVLPESEDDE